MKTCPRCGYIRKESDAIIPETECPKCGIIYAKWSGGASQEARSSSSAQVSKQKIPDRKKHFEKTVLLTLVLILSAVIAVPQAVKYFQRTSREPGSAQVEFPKKIENQVSEKQPISVQPASVTVENTGVAKELSVADIVRENRESIVVVKTPSGLGTGFFINSSGYVVTNRHVLPRGEKAEIKTVKGSLFKVLNVVHEDAQADLVIVSTNAAQDESKPVQLSGRLPDAGEKIIVIGNPLGLEQTVSDGIVSAVRRNQNSVAFIQVTAPVSPGNSGGPLLNMRGEVIGVATFQMKSGQNLNFCVAASRIAGMQEGTNYAVAAPDAEVDIKTPGGQDVYCFADSSGRVSFVDWRTELLVSRPDGTLDRAKYERWVVEQIGGNPDNINADQEAQEDLDRNREKLFKSIFPHRSLDDANLTAAEKNWVERRYQRHYIEIYNKAVMRRNEAIRKYRSMMNDFENYASTRRQ